ncbi:MAG: M24 family metallopeptidase [Sphingobacteriales bacterium]|nr:MAG: M24 family metallopeptidase [Sphingobacteriales bacterium]
MRYQPIDNKLFINNRERLRKQLKPNSVAVFFSNDLMPRSADAFHVFHQNPDLFWLTGVDQEECMLLIFPDAPNDDWKEVLFVRETNETIAIWEGAKLTKQEATQVSGIKTVLWAKDFDKLLSVIVNQAENIYLNLNEHDRYVSPSDYTDLRHVRKIREQFPLHKFERLAPIMHRLRSVKSDIEIELTKQACEITRKGFERILKFVKPGVMEYEIEAELTHEFIRNRSRGHSYEPIIASGANACVLHYVANDQPCKDGDVILLDFGAEYANYNSDLSRSIPVNGRFTKRQRQVYDAVLSVMKSARTMLRPGNTLKNYHEEVGQIMSKELVDLGLISTSDIARQDPAWPAYKKYFMHGTSHFLGLNVHDVGNRYLPMMEGMIFTCEPGIYIPEEGLGIRLENDILITHEGTIDLMANIPLEAEEIEDLMNSK